MINELKSLLTNEIKNTKSLDTLDFDYVNSKLNKFILTYGDVFKKLKKQVEKKNTLENIEKNKYFKEIVKRVRDELRIVYGSFLTNDFNKKEKFLEDKENIENVMAVHKSTKERLEFYDEIYEKIFNWYMPKKIADLACGLNPLSYFKIKDKIDDVEYFASDLSTQDMNFLQFFFDEFNINGCAKSYDITTLEILKDKDFQSSDLVFLFKALDSFESVKKNISKELLEGIEAKKIVVSFPTKSLMSKIEFKKERRNWFYNFLNKKNWEYEEFEVDNEMFILISKN